MSIATRWDAFIPYTAEDIAQFVSAGISDVVVQRLRLERDRQALYTIDVFLYHRKLQRRMVWQFIAVNVVGGSLHLDFPSLFQNLDADWYRLIIQALGGVMQAAEANPQLAQSAFFWAELPVPDDVPRLDGAGENRVAPGFAWNELYIHSAKRYLFAGERVNKMCVLDLGCGTGYGAKLLGRHAERVIAADVDEYPLRYGEETYPDGKIQRIHVSPINGTRGLPFESDAFDAVVCFEVIEHIPVEQMEPFFAEICRVLKPDGQVILSTPNKQVYVHYPDPFHVSLMSAAEFRSLLESRFRQVELFGQVRSRGLSCTTMEFDIVPQVNDEQEIYIAVCRDYLGDQRPIALPSPTVWEVPTQKDSPVSPLEEEKQFSRLPVSVIVHTRNEESNIAECLESVKDWAGEVIVMDMESTDRTVEIARRYTDKVFSHPVILDFDRARNASAAHAHFEWVFYVDADERVPKALVESLRHLLPSLPQEVSAVKLPYKNLFLGKWIQHSGKWYPGYKAPMLLRQGRFNWLGEAHEGVQVFGEVFLYPADDPDCAIEHHSVPSLEHFLRKLNRYSQSAAQQMYHEGAPLSWRTMAAAMGYACRYYYDETQGWRDGAHGFLLAVASAFSALGDQLKYAELRLQREPDSIDLLPPSAEEFFRFAAEVAAGKVPVTQKKLSHILSIGKLSRRVEPPAWCYRLLQRIQRQSQGTLVARGLPLEMLLEAQQRIVGEGEQADTLIALDDDWREMAEQLREGGCFLIGVSHFPSDPEEWRAQLEQVFGGTVHLVDPEQNCPWLFAFGWKERLVSPVQRRILMLTHQRALQMLGGGETQLFETLVALREQGVIADVSLAMRLSEEKYDLLHLFSLYHADKLQRLEDCHKPKVVSTIFRDNAAFYPVAVQTTVFRQDDPVLVEQALQAWREGRLRLEGLDERALDEPEHVKQAKRRLIEQAHILLPNCRWEQRALQSYFGVRHKPMRVVPNAVNPKRFIDATADAFVQRFGLRDFVLCAARIEPFKNQLSLIWALRDIAIPIVLVGKISDPEYGALCRRWASSNVHFIGELSPEMLASAYAAARVHAMPSWAETPGLASLEAGLAGCALVMGNQGAEPEYFGTYAWYCDPADVVSIRQAVLQAWGNSDQERLHACREHILQHFTWAEAARVTAEVYQQVLNPQKSILAMPDWDAPETWQKIVGKHLQEHRQGDGVLLQLYAGILNRAEASQAYQSLADFIEAQGYNVQTCADIEVVDDLPDRFEGDVALTGGRYDRILQTYYGNRQVA